MRRSHWKRGFAGLCAAACMAVLIVLSVLAAGAIADEPLKQSAASGATAIGTPIPAVSSMDTLTAIFTRRSIRKYTDRPVSDETVRILLRAAMSAPSARNEQSWEFVIVRDKRYAQEGAPISAPLRPTSPGAQAANRRSGQQETGSGARPLDTRLLKRRDEYPPCRPLNGSRGCLDNALPIRGREWRA